ncbi:MAG: nitronate monooxygenase [Acidimicrobiales bacterium]
MSRHRLGDVLRGPVVVAPMAGGPSTPTLVAAAAAAGALGFLAAGYKSAERMAGEIAAVRGATAEPFGVNVFVPGEPTAEPAALERYLSSLVGDADAVGAALGPAIWDDDGWPAKLAVLVADPVPVVTFTFGCPDRDVLSALQSAGSTVGVTVTDAGEARLASAAGPDFLCVQGSEAGAHRGTFANGPLGGGGDLLVLLAEVATSTDRPLLAAGGLMTSKDVAAARAAGAMAAQCGTAFLRSPESGAHPRHKEALASGRYTCTEVTRAFSGRPARGLVNGFLAMHRDAPAAYPEVNNATRPFRAAASAAGDVERMSLWAGTGFARATDRPVGEIVEALAAGPD